MHSCEIKVLLKKKKHFNGSGAEKATCDQKQTESETVPGMIPLSLFMGVSARGGGLTLTEPLETMKIVKA